MLLYDLKCDLNQWFKSNDLNHNNPGICHLLWLTSATIWWQSSSPVLEDLWNPSLLLVQPGVAITPSLLEERTGQINWWVLKLYVRALFNFFCLMKFLIHAKYVAGPNHLASWEWWETASITTIFARGSLPRPQNLICFWGRRIVSSTVQNGETCFFITIINKI